MKTLFLSTLIFAASLLTSGSAMAFCGFYASSASAKTFNETSEVVLMRDGSATSLSMRNDYEGPLEDFALVVPVPELLVKEDVKTLPHDLFDKLEALTAPRAVEYWESDPCSRGVRTTSGSRALGSWRPPGRSSTVYTKTAFAVGEYDIVVLSAQDSVSLESWLSDNGYNIPVGASKALAPYIAQGMYFLVAKVDPKRVTMRDGKALLSPLRFQYHSRELSLPVRLGLLNAKGPQDLIIYLLSREGRYEAANLPNVLLPTNLIITDREFKNFDAFYEALFTHAWKETPGAIVTEFAAHAAAACDPCKPGTKRLSPVDLATLGADHVPKEELQTYSLRTHLGRATSLDGAPLPANLDPIISKQVYELEQCYAEAIAHIRNPNPMGSSNHFGVHVHVDANGAVKGSKIVFTSERNDAVLACITAHLSTPRFTPSPTPYTFELFLGIDAKQLYGMMPVLTRLRTRYLDTTSRDDIIFRVGASTVSGGYGGVSSNTRELPITQLTDKRTGRFQGRYARLHPWKKRLTCTDATGGRFQSFVPMRHRKKTHRAPLPTARLTRKTKPHTLSQDILEQLAEPQLR